MKELPPHYVSYQVWKYSNRFGTDLNFLYTFSFIEFWIEYCTYVFKLGDQALTVCKKALRNCPWSEELWVLKLRVLENLKKKEETVMECFEEGICVIIVKLCISLNVYFRDIQYNPFSRLRAMADIFRVYAQKCRFSRETWQTFQSGIYLSSSKTWRG